jgi:hypothetical protein
MEDLVEVSQFAAPAECEAVIAAYERCQSHHASNTGESFWDGRLMGIGSFPDTENEARRILQRWRHCATGIALMLTARVLFSDTMLVVRWDGQSMPPHRDHCLADGTANSTPWREWAGIIYLNDDYVGGRLVFPESCTTYRPVAGSFVLFPASVWHGVEGTVSGMPRYTSTLWLTSDPLHVDPLSAKEF